MELGQGVPTRPSKEMHVNLLQQVNHKCVDLGEEAHKKCNWKTICKACREVKHLHFINSTYNFSMNEPKKQQEKL